MIRPSDIMLHKPSGETWVVCGVDYQKGELIPCGYPFPTLARLADCELVKECYSVIGQPETYIEGLKKHGLDRFIYTEPSDMVEEYVNKKSLAKHIEHHFSEISTSFVVKEIKDFPAADVVEVVRCKDCVHKVELHGRVMCGRTAHRNGNLIMGLIATDADDFCGHGEREGGANSAGRVKEADT